MAERQDAGDVRRRNDDGESRFLRERIGLEIAIFDPTLIPLWLNAFWVIRLGKLRHRNETSASLWLVQRNKRKPEACATLIAPSPSR